MVSEKNSISSDDSCWEAYWALRNNGNVQPLVELLALQQGYLHPLLQREIATMLNGNHKAYRLDIIRNVEGRPKKPKAAERDIDRQISEYVARHPGARKVAHLDAANEFEFSVRQIQRSLKRFDDNQAMLRRALRAHTDAKK